MRTIAVVSEAEKAMPEPPRQEHNHRPRSENRHGHRDRQRHPAAVDKSELPAFLFRPVPVKKPEPQAE